jgi:hypothetical protein
MTTPTRKCLEKVRDILRAGEPLRIEGEEDLGFNMEFRYPEETDDLTGQGCGSAACIAGWVEELGYHAYDGERPSARPDLAGLYYPPMRFDYASITPAQAADAIDNYLRYGDANWPAVLGEVG